MLINNAQEARAVVEVEDLSIGDLLRHRYPLVVPSYQRSYAWEEEELEDFCKDLKDVLSKPAAHHFFGAMVTVRIPQVRRGGWNDTYEVVDGQQRLATFGIFLSCLVSELEWLKNQAIDPVADVAILQGASSLIEQIKEDCLYFKATIDYVRQEVFRVCLSELDGNIFHSVVQDATKQPAGIDRERESHRLLISAAKALLGFVQEFSRPDGLSLQQRLDKLSDLMVTFLDRCLVIHMIALDSHSAKKLFSVINNRGKSLTAGDLLRSSSLELVDGSPQATLRMVKAWDMILGNKRSRVEAFLTTLHASYEGKRPRKHALFEDFFAAFFPPGKTADQYADLVQRLSGEFKLFMALEQGEWPYEAVDIQVKDWDRGRLKHLVKTLDNTLGLSLLMAAASALPQPTFAKLVHLLERVTFRYVTMVGAHVSPLSDRYSKHAKQIRTLQQNYQVASLINDLQALMNAKAPDDRFKDEMRAKLVYARERNVNIRYFLSVLENYWAYCSGASVNPVPDKYITLHLDDLTLEHVYPQNAVTAEPDLEPVVNYLGNLSILAPGENNDLGNKPFLLKQPHYLKARFKLNQALGALPTWTRAEYEARTLELLEYATRVFKPF